MNLKHLSRLIANFCAQELGQEQPKACACIGPEACQNFTCSLYWEHLFGKDHWGQPLGRLMRMVNLELHIEELL